MHIVYKFKNVKVFKSATLCLCTYMIHFIIYLTRVRDGFLNVSGSEEVSRETRQRPLYYSMDVDTENIGITLTFRNIHYKHICFHGNFVKK